VLVVSGGKPGVKRTGQAPRNGFGTGLLCTRAAARVNYLLSPGDGAPFIFCPARKSRSKAAAFPAPIPARLNSMGQRIAEMGRFYAVLSAKIRKKPLLRVSTGLIPSGGFMVLLPRLRRCQNLRICSHSLNRSDSE
jgi:hypothetical protein